MSDSLKQNSLQATSQTSFEARLNKAKLLVKKTTYILSLYSSAIRAISVAPSVLKTEDPQKINEFARSAINAPISLSPTLSQSFLNATKELYPKQYVKLFSSKKPKIKDVITLMDASELASVLGITYCYKLLAKVLDKDELLRIAPLLSLQLRNGAIIGSQLGSAFGRGGGIAASGLRFLGLACLINVDLKAFKALRRIIDDTGTLNNYSFELSNFGFTHLDVASVLAGELGFGHIAREAFLLYQSEKATPTSPLGIYWQHTLTETTKIWESRIPSTPSSKNKKDAIGTLESVDGYKWLWQGEESEEILPGLENNEIENLIKEKSTEQTNTPLNTNPMPNFTPSQDQINILIVEDDPSTAKTLSNAIKSAGNICVCHDSESALQIINNSQNQLPFEIIFLDLTLPNMSGSDLLNNIRQIEKNRRIEDEDSCLIFILTGDDTPQTVLKSFAHKANGYLTKPFKISEIKAELAKFNLFLDAVDEK